MGLSNGDGAVAQDALLTKKLLGNSSPGASKPTKSLRKEGLFFAHHVFCLLHKPNSSYLHCRRMDKILEKMWTEARRAHGSEFRVGLPTGTELLV